MTGQILRVSSWGGLDWWRNFVSEERQAKAAAKKALKSRWAAFDPEICECKHHKMHHHESYLIRVCDICEDYGKNKGCKKFRGPELIVETIEMGWRVKNRKGEVEPCVKPALGM